MTMKFHDRYENAHAAILRGAPVTGACKKAGVNRSNYYAWKNKYGPKAPSNAASRAASKEGAIKVPSPTKKFRRRKLLLVSDTSRPAGKIVLLMGNTTDVLEAAKGLL